MLVIANNIFLCRSPNQWVKDIDVLYESFDYTDLYSTLHQDTNNRFQGRYLYLKPIFTENRSEAASRFKLKNKLFPLQHRDLAKGTRGTNRYLKPVIDKNVNRKITRIWMSEQQEGDGHTDDINRGKDGRSLFLNWSLDNNLRL